VETVLECSAKTIFLVDEAFDFAIKAVLYPTQPLYDMERSTFKPASILAFERIFRLCDVNYDDSKRDATLLRVHWMPLLSPILKLSLRSWILREWTP
jgi:mitochondrial Rho GTPase 1